MKKLREQEYKIMQMSEDGSKRDDHLQRRKEIWEDKLKKKKDEVINISLVLNVNNIGRVS